MAEPEDFHHDFLGHFIDAQRTFHEGGPEPNLTLWTPEDPVTLFAARSLVDSGKLWTGKRVEGPTPM